MNSHSWHCKFLTDHAAYFAARGLDEKGKATLRRVHGGVTNYDVEVEFAIIKNPILEEQQLTGLAFLNTYASLFFKQSGFNNAFLVTAIMGKTAFIFEWFSATLLTFETSPQPSSPS